MMQVKYVIKVIISVVLAVFAFFVVMLCLAMVLKNMKKDTIDTKEELIEYFNENIELFEDIRIVVEENDFASEITRNKQFKNHNGKYIVYYQDTENQDIIGVFDDLEWEIDIINKREESKSMDECIIFTEINGKPMSNYWGVYYVENDSPVGWDGEKRFKPTEKQGEGYFLEAYGCRYYTERICENWWYFEALY